MANLQYADHTHFGSSIVVGNALANSLKLTGAAASSTPILEAIGDDANIKLFLNAKGSSEVRINSRTTVQASGDFIGFQSKPRQGAASSGSVYGCQIGAQISDGIALSGSGSLIGAHVDTYVRGTAAGTIAGDVRGLQIEMTTDDAGTRTISGNVSALRFRAAFSATTITGKFVPIRIEKAETQTNSKQWDAVLELPSTNTGIWEDGAVTSATAAGFIKVLVNGNARYINLFSGTPA